MKDESTQPVSASVIETWIRARIGEFVHQGADAISPDANFDSFGIDSAKAISLITDLEQWLDLPDELPLELLFEAESIGQGARNIATAINEMTGDVPMFRHLR